MISAHTHLPLPYYSSNLPAFLVLKCATSIPAWCLWTSYSLCLEAGKVTQRQSQHWNLCSLQPRAGCAHPTRESPLPWWSQGGRGLYCIPPGSKLAIGGPAYGLLFCSSATIFHCLHFHRVEKPFWPTSWQNLLTSPNTTQPKEWGEPWPIHLPQSPWPSPAPDFGAGGIRKV